MYLGGTPLPRHTPGQRTATTPLQPTKLVLSNYVLVGVGVVGVVVWGWGVPLGGGLCCWVGVVLVVYVPLCVVLVLPLVWV